MTSFEDFYKSLLELVKSFEEKNIQVKIEEDLNSSIVKIFGERITALSRAKNGLSDVEELAFTTAEHHPYWNLLYQCSQISKTTLEKWEDELTEEELEEIQWSLDELKNTCKKLKEGL
jgi:hypothetical protein